MIGRSKKIKNNNNKIKKLYRGLNKFKKADIFLYKACEGDIFFYPAFTSTSTNKNISLEFTKYNYTMTLKDLSEECKCILEIDYNIRNSEVFQEGNIDEKSNYDEKERLFPPFSFFKIKKVYFGTEEKKIEEKNGKFKIKEEIYDGTIEHPFKIELEIIKRNFYLDSAIAKGQKFKYFRNNNEWNIVN